jgi:hemerythrin-like domain-containing protein
MKQYLDTPIKEIIRQFPKVGEILEEYNIGCVPCNVGSCLFKDIIEIHNLSPEDEQALMKRIAKVIYPDKEVTIPKIERKSRKSGEVKYSPPIKKLVDEHLVIKKLVALIPEIIKSLDLESAPGRETISNSLDFIRNYADKYHHAKEEEILFKYFDENLDILDVMHQDHETARGHVRAIGEGLDKKDKPAVAEHLASYHELLKEHIKKEDEILYPWIDRNLSDTQVGELYAKFNKVDEEFGEAPKKYEEFVNKLEERFK